jgi:hypothetical protein
MSPPSDPSHELPTEPKQVIEAIGRRLDALEANAVTVAQFDELKQLLQGLRARLDQIAPPDQVPDEHLAIMSAVFAATIGKRFRIRHVQHLGEPSGWTQAGRVNLHAQRHVRRS